MERGKIRLLALSLTAFTVIAGILAYYSGDDSVSNRFETAALSIRLIEPSWKNNPVIVPEQKIDKDPYIVNTDQTPAYVFMKVTIPAQEITVEEAVNESDKGKIRTSVSEETVLDENGNPLYDGENNPVMKTVTHMTHSVPLFRFVDSAGAYAADPLETAQNCNSGWYLMQNYPAEETDSTGRVTGYTYLYAYTGSNSGSEMEVLEKNQQTTTPLFNKVLFCNAREDDTLPGSRQNIRIEVFGIQSDHLKASDVTETDAEAVWQYLAK